ncbi:hypothetical protein [Bradyrhizobium erythrophlei]|uniref:Uncharacterized protein n=1 Tax=Bradyrhizobium erythrophlei TaxID=1437360 RepID=A0A1M5R0Z9_9BRAD|nr:hypothetical protein [Bradyrhizobium erythrophlei]SHH20117.1 hypothetical protein SAMN05444169_6288 [Bradyrhizobium erythrophlei]
MAEEVLPAETATNIQFHYIKSPDYREIACHGALGGPTPQKVIWMSLFSERFPIPRVVEYAINGTPGEEVMFDEAAATPSRIESRTGVIRHVEVSAYLDLVTAKRLHKWLDEQITLLEGIK